MDILTTAQSRWLQKSNEWWTPAYIIELARQTMGGIDTDPASCKQANSTVKSLTYYDEVDDGLTQQWHGRVWLNPPYGVIARQFMTKLQEELDAKRVTQATVLLNSNAMETEWLRPWWRRAVRLNYKRIKFNSPDALNQQSPTHGSIFIYVGPNHKRFHRLFGAVSRKLDQNPPMETNR